MHGRRGLARPALLVADDDHPGALRRRHGDVHAIPSHVRHAGDTMAAWLDMRGLYVRPIRRASNGEIAGGREQGRPSGSAFLDSVIVGLDPTIHATLGKVVTI